MSDVSGLHQDKEVVSTEQWFILYTSLHKWDMNISFEGSSEIWNYLMGVKPKWDTVSNFTAAQERYVHISWVKSEVYRLPNDSFEKV